MSERGFLRHVRSCNNAELPGERLAFRLAGSQVGWVQPALAEQLAGHAAVVRDASGLTLADPAALPGLARQLAERGLCRWRNEAFDVRARPDGPVLAQIDRGAIPLFGIEAVGVHINGLVQLPDGLHLWVARRALGRPLDPGKLDHIVAGGVPAGLTPADTLVKEAAEEAAIPPTLARQAAPMGQITYAMERAEGLRRDRLFCFDLKLPASFVPQATDGEVERFELWPLPKVAETVRTTDDFKFNVNLVLIDLLMRLGVIAGADARLLRSALTGGA